MYSSCKITHFDFDLTWKSYGASSPEHERLHKTLDVLPADVASVLDVGCGNGRLLGNISPTVRRTGVDHSLAALRVVQVPRCQSDIYCLPFESNGFDAVLATEVIEHISANALRDSLGEVVRVPRKYNLVSVPYCEDLTRGHVVCPACRCQFHRSYHVRSFSRTDIADLFADWPSLRLLHCDRVSRRSQLGFPGARAKLKQLAAIWMSHTRPYARGRVCPQCGFLSGKGNNPHAANGTINRRGFCVKSFVATTMWPKVDTFRWWLALYTKK